MAWSDYPYENPNLNTYIRPVVTELYLAFHERYRIAERIHWNEWIEKPTEEYLDDFLYVRKTSKVTIDKLWILVEDCLERYRDPFYTYNGFNLSDPENFYIFQTWMGITSYGSFYGYKRTPVEFLDYYEQVFGEELVYLKDYLRFSYSSELGTAGKTLTLAGIFKDFYSILKNCLNEVVGYQFGPTSFTAGGYGTRRNTINAPFGSTAYRLSKGARDDDNRVSIAQAYDEALANFNAGNFYNDDVDTQPMTHWGYENYFGSLILETSGSGEDWPWPQGQANSWQNVVEYGNRLVDHKNNFYNYQDKELLNVHYAPDGEEYWDVNLSYVGSENTAHVCPMIIKNTDQWVLDYEFIGNNDVYDFNITTDVYNERRYAWLAVVGSRININEADALEYYIEATN
jgi:hypothetical protein